LLLLIRFTFALGLCCLAVQGRAGETGEAVPRVVSRTPASLSAEALETIAGGPESWTSPDNVGGSLQTMLLLTVVSLAPAILLMSTCYIRIIVVLSLLRQAIGLQTLPPTQVLTSISLFMTLLVMTPVWTRVYEDALQPYRDPAAEMSLGEAYEAGTLPIREFMARQIATAENHADVVLFYRYALPDTDPPNSFGDVPIRVLLPAFVISELKVAFLMGFSIYLPFVVVDLVVASVTMSMGMFMLPPAMISLPLKLLLFVLVDGWHLVVGMLMSSFA
jgi:flagellar biosynthetic protein FliP